MLVLENLLPYQYFGILLEMKYDKLLSGRPNSTIASIIHLEESTLQNIRNAAETLEWSRYIFNLKKSLSIWARLMKKKY